MLHSQIYSLLEVSVSDWLVDDYSDGSRADVVDDARPSYVVLVGERLVLSCVGHDIDNVANLEDAEVRRGVDLAALLEPPLEHVARTRSVTLSVRNVEHSCGRL